MNAHRWHAVGWLVWAIGTIGFFAVWEYIGLRDRADHYEPLTYYIRRLAGTPNSPLWWFLAAILLWMIYHFLFVKH